MHRLVLSGLAATLGLACSGTTEIATPGQVARSGDTNVLATTEPTTATTVSFETEVRRAAIELLEIRNDVFQHPDVARLPDYIAESCACLEREYGIVADLMREGERWTQPAVEPLGLRVIDASRTAPTVLVVARQPPGTVVGLDDAPLRAVPEVPVAPYRVTLEREASGQWRMATLEGETLDEAVADEIVREGVR